MQIGDEDNTILIIAIVVPILALIIIAIIVMFAVPKFRNKILREENVKENRVTGDFIMNVQ